MRGAAFMNEEHILKSTMSLRLYDWGVAPNPVVSGTGRFYDLFRENQDHMDTIKPTSRNWVLTASAGSRMLDFWPLTITPVLTRIFHRVLSKLLATLAPTLLNQRGFKEEESCCQLTAG